MITVKFEDHGQDFLEWDIDEKTSEVKASRPFQDWLWKDVKVTNLRKLKVGALLHFMQTDQEAEKFIKYPISEVTRG